MKRKNSPHSVSSETQSPPPTREAIDDRETGAVGRRSFLRKMAIAGASLAPVLALLVASSAMADPLHHRSGNEDADTILKFKGGIVEIPLIGTPAVPVANVVRGIQPAGTPWVIRALSAEVKADGRIHVEGRGLLLAGGNEVGTNGGASVFATLICGPLPNGPFTVSSTPMGNAVALAADGDFRIDDILSPAPSKGCDNPVLLIRVVPSGVWFTAGIPVVIE
jgi:hypothetical protein